MKSFVFITGATGGLGKAFAAECASRGWNLFLTDRSCEALEALVQGLSRLYGVYVYAWPCDLTLAEARRALWEQARSLGLHFHMLVNVAGIDFEGPFVERSPGELQNIVRLNVEATVDMTQRVLSFRDPTRTLRIINVSSLASYYPMPVKATYAASKRFLLDFSLALDQELRSIGVTLTVLCPAGMPSNPECIHAINAQGWMGQLTTMNVGDVAARAIDAALKGRRVYVPGFPNQVLRSLGSILPSSLVTSLIGKRWKKARQKRFPAPVSATERVLAASKGGLVEEPSTP
jgi:short-subunit dehydrogenase